MIESPRAVIDIGSNAIRLVVYGGPVRAPMPIYNEKARVALGETVSKSGSIDAASMAEAVVALRRFATLADAMGVKQLRAVATAATRSARNGADLIAQATEVGLNVELLSGDAEAQAAAMGILCDAPWADGYVADLGGGSMELARVADGQAHAICSLPMGTIPLAARKTLSVKALAREIADAIEGSLETGLPLYLVGGAWRALGQLHIHLSGHPLHVLSNHAIAAGELAGLRDAAIPDAARRHAEAGTIPTARAPFLSVALTAAEALARLLRPSHCVVSAHGLREGLLYDAMPQAVRADDPLIAAARFEGVRLSRFAYHGDRIADWIAPLFADDAPYAARLRHVACLLADCAWNGHPEYRAELAAELALEGNWPGVDATDRAVIAAALFATYGGKRPLPALLTDLAPVELINRARLWGMAIRLAQRIDGGTGAGLEGVQLVLRKGSPELDISPSFEAFDSPTVRRRLKQLADTYS